MPLLPSVYYLQLYPSSELNAEKAHERTNLEKKKKKKELALQHIKAHEHLVSMTNNTVTHGCLNTSKGILSGQFFPLQQLSISDFLGGSTNKLIGLT